MSLRYSQARMVLLILLLGTTQFATAEDTNEELVGLVVGLLGDADSDIRALGLEQVRTAAPGESATKAFAALLPKLSPAAQVGLVRALADRGDAAARDDLIQLLEATEDDSVNVAVIQSLGALGNVSDTKRLVGLIASGTAAEQAAARKSLTDLPGEATPAAIAAEMKQAEAAQKIALIEILSARRALDTVEEILPAATADDAAIRLAAMKALGELAGPEQLAGMLQGVLKAEYGRERVDAEKRVMFVCNRIEDPEARATPLIAAIDKLSAPDQQLLLSTLGRVGGSAALAKIETAIASDDDKAHSVGIAALSNWPTASIAPRLIEIAQNDDHEGHRITALRAAIRVAPLPDDRSDAERLALLQQAMKLATRDDERTLVLDRARAVRTPESLRFILPYVDEPKFTERTCLSIVELAHHRGLRVPNQAEFDKALDIVIATSKDAVVVDRAQRYKKDETWVRPGK